MTPKAETAPEGVETPNLDIEPLEDEADLSVQRQLEIEEERLVSEVEKAAPTTSSRSDDTEKEEDAEGKLSERERAITELVETRAALRETREQLAHFQKLAEKRQKEEEEQPYDVGELDPTVDVIRPTLNRMGQEVRTGIRSTEQKLLQRIDTLIQRQDDLEAEAVSARMKVTSEEEDQIISWAQKEGRSYNNKKELVKLIEDFRAAAELRELRALKKRKPERKPEASAVTRTRPAPSREAEEDDGETDGFNRSWNKAVRSVMSDLRAGRLH